MGHMPRKMWPVRHLAHGVGHQGHGVCMMGPHRTTPMTTTCLLAWAAVLLLLPLFLLWRAESRRQTARRLRSYGWSQQRIAERLGVTRTTVRRDLALA